MSLQVVDHAPALLRLVDEVLEKNFRQVSGQAEQVSPGEIEIGGERRRTIFLHPPAAITFSVPPGPAHLSFGVTLHPEVWECIGSGPCEFIVELDGQLLTRLALDPVSHAGHRRWHDVSISLPTSVAQNRTLTLRTAGIGANDFRWALFGEPEITLGHDSADNAESRVQELESAIDELATDKENLSFNLYRELMYWNNELERGDNPYILERLDPESLGRPACPGFLIRLVEEQTQALGRQPYVLDFGAGPFSTLGYLHHKQLARVLPVDALAEEFRALLARHDIEWPLTPRLAIGELLMDQGEPETFDIVNVTNALDHTQAPALTWLNLFHLTRTGGYLIHKHSEREASHENFDQLHQFDLFPKETSLWIEDSKGHAFSLTDGLPLTCVYHKLGELDGRPWFWAVYRKDAADVDSAAFLAEVLLQTRRAFERRSRWAFRLEHFINTALDLRHRFGGLPYEVSPNRA
ncbi:MAG: hypothetical protein RL885_31450 [Planctomycetota bacterium]